MSASEELVEVFTNKLPGVEHVNTTGINANRLVAITPNRFFVAVNNLIYDIHIEYPQNYECEKGRQGPFISRRMITPSITRSNYGKPILTLQSSIQDFKAYSLPDGRIQLSAIDSRGRIGTVILDESDENIEQSPPKKRRRLNRDSDDTKSNHWNTAMQFDCHNSLASLLNHNPNQSNTQSSMLAMSGMCGIDCNDRKLVSVSSEYRLLQFADGDTITRSVHLCQRPTRVSLYKHPKNDNWLSLVTEGNTLSVWDERSQQCAHRVDVRSEMYDMDTSKGVISCCGKDKIVYIVDSNKWQINHMWKSSAKYELVSCQFSHYNSDLIYCLGLDHDLICGNYNTFAKKKKKGSKAGMEVDAKESRFQHCFRADSKWIGADLVSHRGTETMIGVTEMGTVYALHKPFLLNPHK